MITASLLMNILVLIPVCAGILFCFPRFEFVFGQDSTARQILLCIYLTILFVSVAILVFPNSAADFLVPLLTIQISYKFLSVIFVKNKKTPVLWFNLAIAIFHLATMASIFSKT